MVATSIFWMMNEFKHVSLIDGLSISIHPNLYQFLIYVSFEIFVQYGFLKFLYANLLLFKDWKDVSPHKLSFLI
jgi:hypothetical protein